LEELIGYWLRWIVARAAALAENAAFPKMSATLARDAYSLSAFAAQASSVPC
jgi:hypothetical protein